MTHEVFETLINYATPTTTFETVCATFSFYT